MSQTTGEKERFHFLDGLRGISISLVALYHAFGSNTAKFLDAHGFHSTGFFLTSIPRCGLEMFFVLSALVTLRPFLRGKKDFKPGQFFWRRIKRIYPPYLGALAFGTLVIYLNTYYPTWYSHILLRLTWKDTIRQLFIIQIGSRYYNLAWWSIQVEFMFYLMVPFIIWWFPRGNRLKESSLFKYVFAGTVISVITQQLFTRFLPGLYQPVNSILSLVVFIDFPVCFLLGTYMAARDSTLRSGFMLFSLGIFVITMSLDYRPMFHTGAGMACAGFTMIVFHSKRLQQIFSTPIMIWIGERSYSIYLIHFSVYYMVNYLVSHITPERNAMYAILTRSIEIPTALFLSMLLFHFVERYQARGLVTEKAFWPWQAKKVIAEQH